MLYLLPGITLYIFPSFFLIYDGLGIWGLIMGFGDWSYQLKGIGDSGVGKSCLLLRFAVSIFRAALFSILLVDGRLRLFGLVLAVLSICREKNHVVIFVFSNPPFVDLFLLAWILHSSPAVGVMYIFLSDR